MTDSADRQPAYAAVYAYIASLPDRDNAYRNAQIWRAVHAALDAHADSAHAVIDRVRAVANSRLADDECSKWERHGYHEAMREVRAALESPAPDAGPTVAECRDHDRAHWNDKYAGEGQ